MIRQEAIHILKDLLKDNSKRKLHVSLSNRRFYNGFVMDFSNKDSLSFKDDKLGYIPLLYSQIINIEPMRKR